MSREKVKNYTSKTRVEFLIQVCDRLWRRIVLLRAGCKCQICGKCKPEKGEWLWIQACHIISRREWSTRWDPRNGVAGCQDCHNHKTIMEWLKRTDKRRYDWVIEQKQKQVSHRDIDLEKVLRDLQAA